ncbi:MAG TPA: hypothetical protein VF737_06785, partial [Gemmatimonadaceae bacterium]
MVRMRWLALALVCCLGTTVHAQTTQDTAKAKSAMTKADTHKASSHMARAHKAEGTKMSMEHKSAKAETKSSKAEEKGKEGAKPVAKTAKHHTRKAA